MDTEPKKIGKYDVIGLIGKGAMGKVYKASDPSSNQIVAIKVLPSKFMDDEASVERFNREAQAIALLNHANVVHILEKSHEDDQLFFVMEYVPGSSLDAVLKQRRLSLPEAIRVFNGVCKGLEAAHKKTIVHRDLSPRNVLVSGDLSVVKLVDFGISRVETISRDHGTLSTSEFSLGSLHYMAPEQARDMLTADHRADIYSLGVLLYEMLTGRVPVGRFNLPSQLNSEVPPEMDPIVLRCLETKPDDRYPTVSRLRAEMRRLEDQLRLGLVHEVREIGSSTSKIFLKSAKNRSMQVGLLGVAAVLVIGAAIFMAGSFTGDSREEEPATQIVENESAGATETGPTQDEPTQSDAPLAEALTEAEAPTGDETIAVEPEAPAASSEPAEAPQAASAPAPVSRPPSPSDLAKDLEVARNKIDAGLYDEARLDLENLIAEHPKAQLTPSAYLLLGMTHEKQSNIDKARASYVELQSRFAGTPEAAESMYRSAELLEATGSRDDLRAARALLDELAEQHPDSSWAIRGLLDKAALEIEANWEIQDPLLSAQVPAALVTYRLFVNRYPEHPGAENAFWNLGEMYEQLKEFDKAARAFESLGERFPDSRHDAWWRAGQIYDRRLDKPDKAIAAYERVPQASRRHAEAQRRIKRLGKR